MLCQAKGAFDTISLLQLSLSLDQAIFYYVCGSLPEGHRAPRWRKSGRGMVRRQARQLESLECLNLAD